MLKKVHAWLIWLSLMLALLISCSTSRTNSPTQISVKVPVQIEVTLPTATKLPIVTSMPSITPISAVIEKCIDVASWQAPPPVETDRDSLVLSDTQPPRSIFLKNLAGGKITTVIDVYVPNFVSQNKKKLAYLDYRLKQIVITDTYAKILKTFFWEKDWGNLEGWLDDDHLLVTTRYIPVYPDLPHDDRLPRLIVLGISDNSRSELSAIDYPKINEVDVLNYLYWPINLAIYDPTLTYAAYPSETKDGAINLFYLPEQKIIASQPSLTASTGVPRWSPDYRYLAVAGISSNKHHNNQDLFLLDKDGHITQLTHLAEDLDQNVSIGLFSWSPDGKNIAFWYWVGDNREKHLAVYQFATETVTDFCVIDGKSGFGTFPVWSPDSQMVVVNTADNNESPYKIVWLNIFTAEGAVMQSSATVHGWLVKP